MVNNWINIIQDYLLPPTCILCGNSGFDSQDICQPCFNDLQRNLCCCYRCAQPFESQNNAHQLCGHCLSTPPVFNTTYAPFMYQHSIRFLISKLKFNQQYKNARLLGYLLARHLDKTVKKPDIIIPVPLHKHRFQERGFNQSTEIAKTLSKHLNIAVDTQSCIRKRNTPHQFDLPAKKRHKNINNAFQVRKIITANHIAIVDDVMTTGSTVNELAKSLKKAGVSRIDIWVCARA